MQSDWGETYVPAGKLTSFHYLASLAAGLRLSINHMDVTTAFLNSEVDDLGLYMVIPEEWDSSDKNSSGDNSLEISASSIVRLQKALYGLKQVPCLWYKDIDEFLQSLEFVQSRVEPNVYIHGKANAQMLLLLYVDDISLAYP